MSDDSPSSIVFSSIVLLASLSVFIVEPFQISLLVGDSMTPTIEHGEVIVYTQYTDIETGDIIVFENPNGETVGHRVIEKENDGYITKGDNNSNVDPYIVEPESVQGVIIYQSGFSLPV